jgi:hypothetical protein
LLLTERSSRAFPVHQENPRLYGTQNSSSS